MFLQLPPLERALTVDPRGRRPGRGAVRVPTGRLAHGLVQLAEGDVQERATVTPGLASAGTIENATRAGRERGCDPSGTAPGTCLSPVYVHPYV